MDIKYKLKIREVPQKKTIYDGSLNKSNAIIKIFIKKQDFLKELKGVLLLMSASVKTPRILFQGKQKENWIIAYEKIENAQTVFEFLNSEKNEIKKNKVIANVILINEDMAQKNLIQKDNYLKNYLINKNGVIYVIDGEQIKKINYFNYLIKWKYLALLISKLVKAVLLLKSMLVIGVLPILICCKNPLLLRLILEIEVSEISKICKFV